MQRFRRDEPKSVNDSERGEHRIGEEHTWDIHVRSTLPLPYLGDLDAVEYVCLEAGEERIDREE